MIDVAFAPSSATGEFLPRLILRDRPMFVLISHPDCNFANKPVIAPVKANFSLLLGDHLFDDTTTNSPFA
jgi:hypothetical protein